MCSGGKVRERPKGENCESNFSESPSNCVEKKVLGNEASVNKLVELLKQRREQPEGENCESNFSESPSNCVEK